MANYPQYGYQPQQMGYQPQMQPMYQQYQTPMQAPQAQVQQEQFFCRPVASAEEARGVPVDFNGTPMIFPQLNAGKIYVKIFDRGSGSAIFREFRMVEEPRQETQAPAGVAFAPMSELESLREYVRRLEMKLESMTRREEMPNDQPV